MKKQNRRTPAPIRIQDEVIVHNKRQLRRELRRSKAKLALFVRHWASGPEGFAAAILTGRINTNINIQSWTKTKQELRTFLALNPSSIEAPSKPTL